MQQYLQVPLTQGNFVIEKLSQFDQAHSEDIMGDVGLEDFEDVVDDGLHI